MANNKLWAVCKDDNEAAILTKYYPGPGGWGGGPFLEQNDFFDKHENCTSNHGCGENILFVTEVEDPRVEFYDFREPGKTKITIKK